MRLVTPGITQYVKQPSDVQASSQKLAAQKAEKSTEAKP
jgi:hypothetical protein